MGLALLGRLAPWLIGVFAGGAFIGSGVSRYVAGVESAFQVFGRGVLVGIAAGFAFKALRGR